MNTQGYRWIMAVGILWTALFSLHGHALEAEAVWIDVRTAEERAEGYLVGVSHIPHDQMANRISEVTTDKNQPIHLFCRSGNRAGIAIETLKGMGYTNLHNEGSFEDAVAARPDLAVKCPACPAER